MLATFQQLVHSEAHHGPMHQAHKKDRGAQEYTGQATQHGGDSHGHHMKPTATATQVAALVGVTALTLLVGIVAPWFKVNLSLGAA